MAELMVGGGWPQIAPVEPPVQVSAVDVQPRPPAPAPASRGLLGFVSSPQGRDLASGLLAASNQLLQGGRDPNMRNTAFARAGLAFEQAQQAAQDRRRKLAAAQAEADLKARQVRAQEQTAQAALERARRRDPLLVSAGAAAIDPVTGEVMHQQPATPRKPIITGSARTGYHVYDQSTGTSRQIIAPAGERPTELQRNLEAAGYTPGTPEYEARLNELVERQGLTNINIDQRAQDKQLGKVYAQRIDRVTQGADAARTQLANLQVLGALHRQLGELGETTGLGTPMRLRAASLFRSLGLEDAAGAFMSERAMSAGEAMNTIANQMALQLRNPATGAGMPGAMSDKDREFLVSMVPGLSMSREGAEMSIAIQRQVLKRALEVEQRMLEYMEQNDGRIDARYVSEASKWANENDVFRRVRNADEAQLLIDTGAIEYGDVVVMDGQPYIVEPD